MKRLMNLRLKRFLCPYCGQWHECEGTPEVRNHNSKENRLKFECSEVSDGYYKGEYAVFFEENRILYTCKELCQRGNPQIRGHLYFPHLVRCGIIAEGKLAFTFLEQVAVKSSIGSEVCHECGFENKCNLLNLGHNHFDTIELGFEFE